MESDHRERPSGGSRSEPAGVAQRHVERRDRGGRLGLRRSGEREAHDERCGGSERMAKGHGGSPSVAETPFADKGGVPCLTESLQAVSRPNTSRNDKDALVQ